MYVCVVAAGPIGRNAEASGSANLKTVAAIYSYSKTRGLFAGVSLEGSVIVSRGDANEKLYGQRVTANELLTGVIPPPPEADALYRALNAKFHTLGSQTYNRSIGDGTGERSVIGRSGTTFKSTHISAPGTLRQPPPIRQSGGYGAPMSAPPPNYQQQQPPTYQQQNNYQQQSSYNNSYGQDVKPPINSYNNSPSYEDNSNSNNFAYQAAAKRAPPPPPPSRRAAPSEPTARALYAFDGQQDGDLSFREGEIITIVQKTDSQDDWWTGKVNGRQGIVSIESVYMCIPVTNLNAFSSLLIMFNYNNKYLTRHFLI